MIAKQADLFDGEVPEAVKDFIWDNESGFFENSLRWGGRGLMLASGPLAILNIIAGMMGFGLSDLGKILDKKVSGIDPSTADPKQLASQIADDLYPALEARAALFNSGLVSLAAEPVKKPAMPGRSSIRFEAEQPAVRRVPAPIDFGDGPVPGQAKPVAKSGPVLPPDPLAAERAKMEIKDDYDRRRYQRRMDQLGLTHEQQLKLRAIDEADAKSALERKKELDRHHADMEHNKFMRDRDSMEHQIGTKHAIEDRYYKERKMFDLQREFVTGKITPEQYRLTSAALAGRAMAPEELDKIKKSMTRSERNEVKRRLELENMKHRQDMKQRADFQKQELRNTKLMAAARSGNTGLVSAFRGKVGKLGVAAAIAALLFAGFKSMSGGGGGHINTPRPPSPRARYEDPVASERASVPSVQRPSNKGPRSISNRINTELEDILGE